MHPIRKPFASEKSGVAALEFAIIAPLLFLLFLGVVEMFNAVSAGRRLETVAASLAQMLTQSTTGNVNYVDLQFAADSTMVLFPQVLTDAARQHKAWGNDISITMSSIVFSLQNPACTSSCTYNARVAWSWGSSKRPCGVNLAAVADTAAPSSGALPTDAFAPGSMIVVDTGYTYTPLVWTGFFPSYALARSTYIQPRYISPTTYIKYATVSGDPGNATVCPGY